MFVFPAVNVLPMGFSWSFYLAQESHRHLTECALPGVPFMSDHRPSPPLGEGRVLVYADNGTHLGMDEAGVNARKSRVKAHLDTWGLEVHEETEAGTLREPLGTRIDGKLGVVKCTAHRIWRLSQALTALRAGAEVSGDELERVVGHITFICLLYRLGLSLLCHSYVYIRSMGSSRGRLWKKWLMSCGVSVRYC